MYLEKHIKIFADFGIQHPESTLVNRISTPQNIMLSDISTTKVIRTLIDNNIEDIQIIDVDVIVLDINEQFVLDDFLSSDFSVDTQNYISSLNNESKHDFMQQALQYVLDKCVANIIYVSPNISKE